MNHTPCNEDRADNARKALAVSPYDKGDEAEGVIDLLTNLMHLCRREGFDFERLLGTAGMHFEAESEEEPAMRTFSVIITRDITESTVIEVEAQTKEEAEAAALDKLRDAEDTQWEVDEGSWNQSSPYITGTRS